MKKRILAAILAVLMVFPLALGVFASTEQEEVKINYLKQDWKTKEARLEVMELCATSENGKLEMYFDKNSGEMGIKNLQTGEIILSNPIDVSKSTVEPSKVPSLLSHLNVVYTVITDNTKSPIILNSYKDCFACGQAVVTPLESGDGIKIDYMFGEQKERLLVPYKISVEDMNALLSQFSGEFAEAEKMKILSYYTLYDPASLREQGNNEAADAFAKVYPISETVPLYAIVDHNADYEWMETLIKNNTDYDFDKLDADYAKVKEDSDDFSTNSSVKITLSATYQITNTGLVAKVDASSIDYDKSLYYVTAVSILPYFNSANAYERVLDESTGNYNQIPTKGYCFIPDGSGSIVRFEDVHKDKTYGEIVNDMYGNDYAYYVVTNKNVENVTMPVFGLVNSDEKTGFVAKIGQGASISSIVSNHNGYYNSVYSNFKITPNDTYDLADAFSGGSSSSNKISIIADKAYKGICEVEYVLLTDDSVAEEKGITEYYPNSYVGMAQYYRDYLVSTGAIDRISEDEINPNAIKLFLETFGALKVSDTIMTFPVMVSKPLTTFDDIKNMYADLKGEGVTNVSFMLNGFANGGLLSTYPTSIDWEKVLGGKGGFVDLLKDAEEEGYEVVPELDFSYSYSKGSMFSKYSNKKHALKTLDGRYSTKRTYYAATQTFERTGGVAVSSGSFDVLYEKLYESLSDYSITTLATRSLGSDLNSDFDEDEYYDREASMSNVVTLLKLLKGEGGKNSYKLVLDAGNSYSIPYADVVLSASLDSSRRQGTSEAIPFYGMVYHGYIEFTGSAFNMEGDTEYMFLKAIENGAGLYFTVAKQNVELLKFEPTYNKYYSVSFDNLKKTIIETYKEYNNIMKDLQTKLIVDHSFLNNGEATRDELGKDVAMTGSQVVRVDYEGGAGFILNYSEDVVTVTIEGINGGKSFDIAGFGYAKYQNGELVVVSGQN
ncbi:MAG: hypothetical protein J6B29_00350 [Clostridia bacterium]|nr:hypothetical protein [Clostridia bacterium]